MYSRFRGNDGATEAKRQETHPPGLDTPRHCSCKLRMNPWRNATAHEPASSATRGPGLQALFADVGYEGFWEGDGTVFLLVDLEE